MEWVRTDGFRISDDRAELDRRMVCDWLSTKAYWALGRSSETIDRAIDNSLCLGLFAPSGQQVGFGRWITDYATWAQLMDVFVIEDFRARGLGVWLTGVAISHPDVADLGQSLMTKDAHGLYERYGFEAATGVVLERYMLRSRIANRAEHSPEGS